MNWRYRSAASFQPETLRVHDGKPQPLLQLLSIGICGQQQRVEARVARRQLVAVAAVALQKRGAIIVNTSMPCSSMDKYITC